MPHKDKLNPYQMLYNTVGNNFTSKPVETEEQKQEKKKIEIFKEIPIWTKYISTVPQDNFVKA